MICNLCKLEQWVNDQHINCVGTFTSFQQEIKKVLLCFVRTSSSRSTVQKIFFCKKRNYLHQADRMQSHSLHACMHASQTFGAFVGREKTRNGWRWSTAGQHRPSTTGSPFSLQLISSKLHSFPTYHKFISWQAADLSIGRRWRTHRTLYMVWQLGLVP